MTVTRSEDPIMRRAQRVLQMVHELHKRGYQRLRILPAMAPSGGNWRLGLTPASNVLRDHGALPRDDGRLIARYGSAEGNEYFGWTDAKEDSARQLADKFLERFPEVSGLARGRDWAYVGWYTEMLGLAEQGALPIAYTDYTGPERDRLRTLQDGVVLPAPPPGEALPPDSLAGS